MNYQLLLECYSSGTEITKDELQMLDIELDTQLESIKVSGTQGCLKIAPKHICETALVCKGSFWITCLAAVLDKCSPPSLGSKAKGAIVFDELVRQGYVATD
tara:strand:+ start:196 stop:501 length:306 start_codon:yes stop_codon:yes gene_type:complete